MFRISDVAFAYGDRVILSGVTFTVPRGRILGLLGPNGSGKTTLLRIMAGTLPPDRGQVEIADVAVNQMSRREIARRIAVVPQETHSTFDFTVEDIVLMGRYPHLGAFELEGPNDRAIAGEALRATGMRALASRRFATLSGGEKQRVVIAGALAQASDALLLDEPTASLDLGAQLDIAALLARLHRDRGTTMVVCTHDLNFAASLCAELVLIRDGRILAQGETAQVLTPANVAALYGVEADVAFHPGAKHLTVVPIARA